MEVLINGILFGFALTFFVGPVFFALIQTSIEKGFVSGASMALGISLSDMIYVAAAYIGVSHIFQEESTKAILSIAGGIILLVFGLASITKPAFVNNDVEACEGGRKIWRNIVKGFLLNGMNPSVLLFWIAAMSIVSAEYQYEGRQAFIFLTAIILTVFTADIIKSYLAHRLRRSVNEKRMAIVNKVIGAALVVFAVRLLYSGFVVAFIPAY